MHATPGSTQVSADPGVYARERLAKAYAATRPPVHPLIVDRAIVVASLAHVPDALDVGSGGGASTAALLPYADRVVGVDPSDVMVAHATIAVPRATFRVGAAEQLPFDAATFDLVASAGAINYSDPPRALTEMRRVLRRGGVIILYDFSTGRVDDPAAADVLARFRELFPSLPGYAIDLEGLPFDRACLRRQTYERLAVRLVLSSKAYVEYLLGDTAVEAALAEGTLTIDEARARVQALCAPLFEGGWDGRREVIFDSEFVLATA